MAPRGDGRLNHDLLPGEKGPQDACGVFGVWAPGEEVAKLTYFGLYALQHRGQESAGSRRQQRRADPRLQGHGPRLPGLRRDRAGRPAGHIAVGHARYSTTGAATWENAQPTLGATAARHRRPGPQRQPDQHRRARRPRRRALRQRSAAASSRAATPPTRPSSPRCSRGDADHTARGRRRSRCCRRLRGAFCLVFMDEHTLYAARDPQGVRPLVPGPAERGWVVASETARPRHRAAPAFVREIEPGEFIAIDERRRALAALRRGDAQGLRLRVRLPRPPGHHIAGRSVHAVARRDGPPAGPRAPRRGRPGHPGAGVRHAGRRRLRRGVAASRSAQGLVKNAYVGRTFIQPSQTLRQLGIRLKLNPLRDVIRGKRLVVVDDSIVRGNTQRALVAHAPRGRRGRGPRPDLLAAGEVAVLLRHRLRRRVRSSSPTASTVDEIRGLDRRRLPRLHLRGGHDRGDRAAASNAVHRVLHRRVPDRAARTPSCSASTCSSRPSCRSVPPDGRSAQPRRGSPAPVPARRPEPCDAAPLRRRDRRLRRLTAHVRRRRRRHRGGRQAPSSS